MVKKEVQALTMIFIVITMGLIYAGYQVNRLQEEVNELRSAQKTIVETLYIRVGELENLIVECMITIDNSTENTSYTVYLIKGATALEALRRVAVVETTYYTGLGEFVASINGVRNDASKGMYWMWYIFDKNEAIWKVAPVGAGSYIIEDGESITFRYEMPSW